jgi:hypothetical protein
VPGSFKTNIRQGGTEQEIKITTVALNCVFADQCEAMLRLHAQALISEYTESSGG